MKVEKYNMGVIAGNFDVIHPGYIKMFKECKTYCKPILSREERTEILTSIKYIDGIAYYTYEKELVDLIYRLGPDIRFLGDDYRGKTYTGFELDVPVHYLNRDHGWSTTKFKKLIADTL